MGTAERDDERDVWPSLPRGPILDHEARAVNRMRCRRACERIWDQIMANLRRTEPSRGE